MNETPVIRAFFYNNPDNYPPIINGSRLLNEAGWKVKIYCRDDGASWNIAYPPGVDLIRIKTQGNSWRQYSSFVRRALRSRTRADLYIGHDMHGFLPACVLAFLHHRPLLYFCYDYADSNSSLNPGSRLVMSFLRWFARRADVVTVPDAGLAALLKRDLRLRKDPIVVVNSPLKPLSEGGALRRALAAREKQFARIVFRQGRVGPGHGIEATIRSIPLWTNSDSGFVVMGLADPAFVKSMESLAAESGVQDRFLILPPVSYDALGQFTPDANIGHALYEPIHINNQNIGGACKVHEYMAAGVPLLVSRQPSLNALVDKYGCGIHADETSPQSIAAAIDSLLGDEESARRMGAAGRRAFQEVFSYERQAAPVLKLIKEIRSHSGTLNRETEFLLNA